ncbi:MAG TPA: hypothetical protein VGA27_06865 [Candidatus Binatia bacterium]
METKSTNHSPWLARSWQLVALTAHALSGDAENSLQAGCTAHVTKPIKKLKLIETISQFAAGKEL